MLASLESYSSGSAATEPAHEGRIQRERSPTSQVSAAIFNLDGTSYAANSAAFAGMPPYVEDRAAFASDSENQLERQPRGDDMATDQELTDAKLRTVAAETDTKIARLEGKLDLVLSKLDSVNENTLAVRRDVKDSERAVKSNAYVLTGAILALIVGIVAIIPFVFDLGMKNRETISRDVEEKFRSIQTPVPPSIPQSSPSVIKPPK